MSEILMTAVPDHQMESSPQGKHPRGLCEFVDVRDGDDAGRWGVNDSLALRPAEDVILTDQVEIRIAGER